MYVKLYKARFASKIIIPHCSEKVNAQNHKILCQVVVQEQNVPFSSLQRPKYTLPKIALKF